MDLGFDVKLHKQRVRLAGIDTPESRTRDKAEKVLEEVNQAILMLEGGVQAKESLLKKIEQECQLTGTVELGKPQGKMSSKSKA